MPRKPRGTTKLYTPEEQALLQKEKEAQAATALPPTQLAPPPQGEGLPIAVPPWTHIGSHIKVQDAFEWAGLARSGKILRPDLSDTQAALIVLKGGELGIPPLRALEHIYLAQSYRDGNRYEFVMQAELMRALVLEKGLGAIEPVWNESTDLVGVVLATRKDFIGQRSQRFTYSVEDATNDGLLLRSPEWRSGANRKALLIARATSIAWRMVFADTSCGLGYAPEDLEVGAPSGNTPQNGSAEVSRAVPGESPPPPQPAVPPTPQVIPPEPVGVESSPSASAGPAGKPRERWFHAWNAPGQGGAPPRPVLTAGVTLELVKSILSYSVEGRGFARWQEARVLLDDYLEELSLPEHSVTWLTLDEGTELLYRLDQKFGRSGTPPPAEIPVQDAAPPPPASPALMGNPALTQAVQEWVKAKARFDAMIARREIEPFRVTLEQMIVKALNVASLHEAKPEDFARLTDDIDRFAESGVLPTMITMLKDRFEKEGADAPPG